MVHARLVALILETLASVVGVNSGVNTVVRLGEKPLDKPPLRATKLPLYLLQAH